MNEWTINLLTNPYTWVFIIFTLSLSHLLKYIRKFYPQSLREKMEKEEACNLEYHQKPEIKRLRRILVGIIILILSISYLIAFKVIDFGSDKNISLQFFNDPKIVLSVLVSFLLLPAVFISSYYEKKIIGKHNCEEVIVGAKIGKVLVYILGIL